MERLVIKGATRALGLIALILMAASARAAEPVLDIRAQLSTKEAPVIGQRVLLQVDVMTSTWFASAPEFPSLSIDGAVVIQPTGFGLNLTERIGGTTFTIQRREYQIYPQRAGVIEMPLLRVKVTAAGDGGQPVEPKWLEIMPSELQVESLISPDGSRLGETSRKVVASSLKLQELASPPSEARTGNAFERRIRITADKTLAMLIPPLPLEVPKGVRLFKHEPKLSDASNRGEARAVREERISYYFETAGEKVLPALVIDWWNVEEGQWEQAQLEEITIEVSGKSVSSAVGTANTGWKETLGWAMLLLLLLVPAWLLYQRAPLWLAAYRDSEYRYFQALGQASAGDPRSFTRALYRWLDRRQRGADQPATLRAFSDTDSDMLNETLAYQREHYASDRTYGSDSTQTGGHVKNFYQSLKKHRAKMQSMKAAEKSRETLPELNPGGTRRPFD